MHALTHSETSNISIKQESRTESLFVSQINSPIHRSAHSDTRASRGHADGAAERERADREIREKEDRKRRPRLKDANRKKEVAICYYNDHYDYSYYYFSHLDTFALVCLSPCGRTMCRHSQPIRSQKRARAAGNPVAWRIKLPWQPVLLCLSFFGTQRKRERCRLTTRAAAYLTTSDTLKYKQKPHGGT